MATTFNSPGDGPSKEAESHRQKTEGSEPIAPEPDPQQATGVPQPPNTPPDTHGTTEKSASGPLAKSTSDEPADQGSGDKPPDKGSGDKPPDKGSDDTPVDKSSEDKPPDKGSGDKSPDKGSDDKPVDKSGEDKSPDKGSDDKTADKSAEDKSPDKGSGDNPPDKGSDDTPVDKSSEDKPPDKGSGDKPPDKGSGDKPPDNGSDDKPADKSAEDKSPDKGTGDKPPDRGSDDKPADKSSEDKTPDKGSGDKPPDKGSDDKPADKSGGDKAPDKGSDEKPPGKGSDDKPSDTDSGRRTGPAAAPRTRGRIVVVPGEGDCYFYVPAYFLSGAPNNTRRAKAIRKECAACMVAKVFGPVWTLESLTEYVLDKCAKLKFTQVVENLSLLKIHDETWRQAFEDGVAGDPSNGGFWPIAAWIVWLQYASDEVPALRKKYENHPLRVGLGCFSYTLWGEAHFTTMALQEKYPKYEIDFYNNASQTDKNPGVEKIFNFVGTGRHFNALEFDPIVEGASSAPVDVIIELPEAKKQAPLPRPADAIRICRKCTFSYLSVGCLCVWCSQAKKAADAKEEVKALTDAALGQGNGPANQIAPTCPAPPQDPQAQTGKQSAEQAKEFPPPKARKKVIWQPYLTQNAAAPVQPMDIEHDYPFDIIQFYPDPKGKKFKPGDVTALKRGGNKVCLLSDERYDDKDAQTAVSTCTHLDLLVREADRIIFRRAEALRVAASLIRIGSYEGFWRQDHISPGKTGGDTATDKPGKQEIPDKGKADEFSGDLPDVKFNEFDPKTLRRFFLASAESKPVLDFVYGTLAIGDDAAYRFDLDMVTDSVLSRKGTAWPNQDFLDYLHIIRQPSGLQPAARDAKALYAVPYRCLPERLRWLIWAIRYGAFLIDSADDPEKDTAFMSAPSSAGSMRSWHADLKGNLPVLTAPSGSGETVADYLEQIADRWRSEIGGSSTLNADQQRTGMYQSQVRKYKWLPSELFKEFRTAGGGKKGKSQKTDKDEQYIDEWMREKKKADDADVRNAVHSYQRKRYTGYTEWTGNGQPLGGTSSEGSGFLGFAQTGAGDRLVYDYLNHRVYLSPKHYNETAVSNGETTNPFYLIADIDPADQPQPWPVWLPLRDRRGPRRDKRSEWYTTIQKTHPDPDRPLLPLDHLLFRSLTRATQAFFSGVKPAQPQPVSNVQDLWNDAGYESKKLMEPIIKEQQKAAKEDPTKSAKGQKKSSATQFVQYKIESLQDLPAIVRAQGEDTGAHRVGRVLILPGGIALILTPSDVYAYPVLIGGKTIVDSKKIAEGYSPEYDNIVGAMSLSPAELFGLLLGETKPTANALGGSVAHWICECSRNWRQMSILILFAAQKISSRKLHQDGWLPIGPGGWSHHGTWGVANNPFSEPEATPDEDGDNTGEKSRRRFSRCLVDILTMHEFGGEFIAAYIKEQRPEEEVEDLIVRWLSAQILASAQELKLI